ncbi:MAG: hypothetical protein JJ975_01850 [Bacteroidia bacterium]|nr:hypothetical protein [Bacteroidia bacterium]
MKKLKEDIFLVLCGMIELDEFETRLYTNPVVIDKLEEPGFILDVVCLNYGDKWVFEQLRALAFEEYEYEEYLVFKLEKLCYELLKTQSCDQINAVCNRILAGVDSYPAYSLFNKFRYLEDYYYFVRSGDCLEEEYVDEIHKEAREVVNGFRNKTLSEKKELLYDSVLE